MWYKTEKYSIPTCPKILHQVIKKLTNIFSLIISIHKRPHGITNLDINSWILHKERSANFFDNVHKMRKKTTDDLTRSLPGQKKNVRGWSRENAWVTQQRSPVNSFQSTNKSVCPRPDKDSVRSRVLSPRWAPSNLSFHVARKKKSAREARALNCDLREEPNKRTRTRENCASHLGSGVVQKTLAMST